MKIIERYNTIFNYTNILVLLYMSYRCLHLWVSPSIDEVYEVEEMVTLLVIEFLLVHSAIFTFLPKSPILFFLISGLYVLFAYMLIKNNSSLSVFVSYCFVIFNRIHYVFFDISEIKLNRIARMIRARAIFYITFFIIWILLFVNLEEVEFGLPKFGLTSDFFENSNSQYYKNMALEASVAVKYPHIFMSFGVLYFLGLVYIELKIDSLIPPKIAKIDER